MKSLSITRRSIPEALYRVRNIQSKSADVSAQVQGIINAVKTGDDAALYAFTKKFDGVSLKRLAVTKVEIAQAYRRVNPRLLGALRRAKANIELFHRRQLRRVDARTETKPGVKLWREFRPIERVGLYVPGGKAVYPSTVLMLATPAQIAGCKEIVLCVPPNGDGKVPEAILVAADLCGISKIYKVGGAQAIAAMAYGTKTIAKVSKIFGPGNQYVTTAKMLVYGEVDIDMPAGPSEVLVLADASAKPQWVAADLLSQLEHGEDSQAILVTFSRAYAQKVIVEMIKQKTLLARSAIIEKSFQRSFAVIADSLETAYEFINAYAPEHLEIVVKNEARALNAINNAGSIFLGKYTSEPLGDYATGANHTLPTSGYAKMFSALSVESFGKKMQVQKVSRQGIMKLRSTVEILAASEGLDAHKNAITIRFKK